MRRRTTRLGRWRRRISAATKFVADLVRFVETLTILMNKLTRLVYALAGLAVACWLFVAALR